MSSDAVEEQLADEESWQPITGDNPLLEPPSTVARPLLAPAPELLNTHELSWPAFERLLITIARDIEGARDARLYGKPGQRQEGIDVVGFFLDKKPTVYQAKKWREFRAADLRAAVNKYTRGKRPFGAERLVIAVASEVRDTAVIDELHSLNTQHSDLNIDLWDRATLSELLRPHWTAMARFFGPATADAFSGSSGGRSNTVSNSIASDAVIRGPIAHLDLKAEHDQALECLKTDPLKAAQLFQLVASRLENSPYRGHAAIVRDQQATSLVAAGQNEAAASIRISLGWHHYRTGDRFFAVHQAGLIGDHQDDLSNRTVRAANALYAGAAFGYHHKVTLDDVVEAFDALQAGDPHRIDSALNLAEQAVTWRRIELIRDREEVLTEIAKSLPNDNESRTLAARLYMCLADSLGNWHDVVRQARNTCPPKTLAWVLARHARYLTLTTLPELATDRWKDAIERATQEGLNDDAANWLYALRSTVMLYDLPEGDRNNIHRLAQALRASGGDSVLPPPYPLASRSLSRLIDKKFPDAFEALHQYLARSTVVASLADELAAHERFGDLYIATGQLVEAATNLIRAGQLKKLEKLARELPEQPFTLPSSVLESAPWMRSSAYRFIAGAAELLPDDLGRAWLNQAFADTMAHDARRHYQLRDVAQAAFKLFSQLAPLATGEEAQAFIDLGGELLPRGSDQYRHTDDDHVDGLLAIARTHKPLQLQAVGQLCDGLLAASQLGDRWLTRGGDVLRAHPNLIEERLADAAKAGNIQAATALVVAEADTRAALNVARQRMAATLSPKEYQPGVQTYGIGLQRDGVLVSILPEEERVAFIDGMLKFAGETRESIPNRAEAIGAIAATARGLESADTRDHAFAIMAQYARGEYAGSSTGRVPDQSRHPLNRFQFDLGAATLIPQAFYCACVLAHHSDQYDMVQKLAIDLLAYADNQLYLEIGRGLSRIPVDSLTVDVNLFAAHPNKWLRTSAAVAWATAPERWPELGERLAKDPEPSVRLSLARNLDDHEAHVSVRQLLINDPRRSVRLSLVQ